MKPRVFRSYLECIGTLEASEQISSFTQTDWPHMKKDKRKEIFKKLKKRVDAFSAPSTEDLTEELLKEMISG